MAGSAEWCHGAVCLSQVARQKRVL